MADYFSDAVDAICQGVTSVGHGDVGARELRSNSLD